MSEEDLIEEGLGMALASFDWDAAALMRVAANALEDANFHDEAEQLRRWAA